MKNYTFLLFLLFLAQSVCAQDPGYTGPAKNMVQAFWDLAAKLDASVAAGGSSMDGPKLLTLEKKINDVKNKDAAYNTSAMESKLKACAQAVDAYRKKNENAQNAYKEKMDKESKTSKMIYELFHISTDVDNGGLGTIGNVIENYKKKTQELLLLKEDITKRDLEKFNGYIKNDLKTADNDLLELDRRCREQTDPKNAEVQYYELQYKQAYWDAAQKIFPEEKSFAVTYDLATKLLAGLGTLEDVHKIASKSKQQKINETRLPAAVAKDAALEKTFMEIFNKQYGEEYKGTATKAILLSDDWTILRNEITGIVTGRRRHAVIVYKGTNGKCYLTSNFFIHQEYVGNAFINTKSIYVLMGSQEMLCEHAK
jgi:hypothetical protein